MIYTSILAKNKKQLLSVRDLWRQKDLGTFEGVFETDVPQHGVVMIRLRPVE
jgi:alpha-galactosidase